MSNVIRVTHPGGVLLLPDQGIEQISEGNQEPGQDGNYRTIIQNGKSVQQKLKNGTWTTLKSLS